MLQILRLGLPRGHQKQRSTRHVCCEGTKSSRKGLRKAVSQTVGSSTFVSIIPCPVSARLSNTALQGTNKGSKSLSSRIQAFTRFTRASTEPRTFFSFSTPQENEGQNRAYRSQLGIKAAKHFTSRALQLLSTT